MKKSIIDDFNKAILFYTDRNFKEALGIFKKLADI
jgi:hypothetical protein